MHTQSMQHPSFVGDAHAKQGKQCHLPKSVAHRLEVFWVVPVVWAALNGVQVDPHRRAFGDEVTTYLHVLLSHPVCAGSHRVQTQHFLQSDTSVNMCEAY